MRRALTIGSRCNANVRRKTGPSEHWSNGSASATLLKIARIAAVKRGIGVRSDRSLRALTACGQ